MKEIIVSFFLLSFITIIYPQNNRFIEVTGNALVEVPADEVSWNIHIRKIDNTFNESKTRCYKAVDGLLEILQKIGIDRDKIDLPPIQQTKEYDYTKDREKIFKGFATFLIISFKLKDLSKYESLVEELSKSNEFENISSKFGDSIYEENHKQALRNAINTAMEKAKYLAKELNLDLGKVLEIKESNTFYPNPMNNITSLSAGVVDTQIVGGTISYNRSVIVKIELIDEK